MSKYTLLIGSTGLVGRYLIRDLLLAGHRLALVIRSTKKQDFFQRLEEILQMWEAELGYPLPRPVCFEGDVSRQGLGLSEADQRWVAKHCDSVIHNAAVLTFFGSDPEGEPWRTNVQGTRHVLELCRKLDIRRMHYVSTAYVSGIQQDVVIEDEMVEGQTFRNDYEHSKFLAESMVRQADFLDSTTIYRPSVIAGDSRTGYTNTYHGLYMYLKLISVLVRNQKPDANGVRHTPVKLHMTGDEARNIVPVEWVSAVISQLFDNPASHGKTYHLTPSDPITPRQIVEAGYKYFNSQGVEFIGTKDRTNADRVSNIDEDLHSNMTMYESYEVTDPKFDTTNLLKFAGNLPCPKIDEAMLHRFWKFGEEDRWGKRRSPKVNVPYWVREHLEKIASRFPEAWSGDFQSNSDRVQHFGLDVSGPGGSQWTVAYNQETILKIEAGLPQEDTPILHLTTDEFFTLGREKRATAIHQIEDLFSSQGILANGNFSEAVYRTLFAPLHSAAPALSPPVSNASDSQPTEAQASVDR